MFIRLIKKIFISLFIIEIIYYFPLILKLLKIDKTHSSDELIKKYSINIYIDKNKILNGYGKEIILKGVTSNEFRYKNKVNNNIDDLKNKILFFKNYGINLVVLYLDNPIILNKRKEELVTLAKWADLNNLYILFYPVVNEIDVSTTRIAKGVLYGPYDNRLDDLMMYLSIELKYQNNVLYGTGAEPHDVNIAKLIKKQNDLIDIIRSNDEDAVIVVNGTEWGSSLDFYLDNPISKKNILYDKHYYVSNNKKNLKFENCTLFDDYLNKLPILYGEFGGVSQDDFASKEDLICTKMLLNEIKYKKISFSMFTLDHNSELGLYINKDEDDDLLSEKGKVFVEYLKNYLKH